MQGKLYTQDFLTTGIKETSSWKKIPDEEIDQFKQTAFSVFNKIAVDSTINESTTESEIILPILDALGWNANLPQQSASRKEDKMFPIFCYSRMKKQNKKP